MKFSVLLSLALFIGALNSYSQSTVIADVGNFENNKGVCKACLFNSAASFNGENGTPVQCVQVAVSNRKSQIQFTNVSAGTYAVFLFHDTNKNNKMDKNFLGIPKEGYGASKNSLPFASAPSFNDNKFTVAGNATIRLAIKLRNL